MDHAITNSGPTSDSNFPSIESPLPPLSPLVGLRDDQKGRNKRAKGILTFEARAKTKLQGMHVSGRSKREWKVWSPDLDSLRVSGVGMDIYLGIGYSGSQTAVMEGLNLILISRRDIDTMAVSGVDCGGAAASCRSGESFA
ncbi:hypothetical protein TWF569_006821 [Orbilia oligospora]|uniref:Uncharacterized protein n=1 Tax=Orbilia oligospora TaxID=2813651 RepID=A0A7C8KE61_ORBOL|nr:hypothetical protein TWF706_006085 [Orbilia oligospora]KAF3107981.1 hypothetical protein TWF102_011467 [Orbilia oligospora]KAF3116551.1 hypothetical protein TWF103_008313 [Orbilia oligospora]KAF3128194.1 hypothetical protein TWF594_011765 [Orbilia oligospora]KAF3135775.1 hypothetical protein TWF703_005870 [Orbilia oligospora]